MKDAIQSLIQLLKAHPPQVLELEDDLYELTRWLEKHWEWRDWCALAPGDPEEPHPMEKPKDWQIFHPDKPYYPCAWDEELPL
jgi:hypothetical protein